MHRHSSAEHQAVAVRVGPAGMGPEIRWLSHAAGGSAAAPRAADAREALCGPLRKLHHSKAVLSHAGVVGAMEHKGRGHRRADGRRQRLQPAEPVLRVCCRRRRDAGHQAAAGARPGPPSEIAFTHTSGSRVAG